VWGSVLALALLGALNPIRLSLALLVISRPKPVPNLVAYWAGLLTVSVPALAVPLTVLHVTPAFNSFERPGSAAADAALRHVQLGVGALATAVAVFLAVRFWGRRPVRELVPAGDSDGSAAPRLDAPTAITRLLGETDEPTGGKPLGRLARRIRRAWREGSYWVAFALGLVSGPSADGVLYVVAIIAPSGATLQTQLCAAMVFVAGSGAVVELVLIAYLVKPAMTERLVGALHDWARTHRRKVLVATFAVLGLALLSQGLRG
jgi:hypothetical protein